MNKQPETTKTGPRRVTDFRINATPEQVGKALLKGGQPAPRDAEAEEVEINLAKAIRL